MVKVDLTPAKLAQLKQKAKSCSQEIWEDSISVAYTVTTCGLKDEAQFIAAADPATVLAMVEEIERLRGLQCWVIMRKDNRDQVFDGPFFTEEDARFHVLDSVDHEYTVEPWVNQANVRESEAGQ